MNLETLAEKYTYEELAGALYLKGETDGYPKVTDKTKWREPVIAEKLGHIAHKKISAGKDSEKYGSDAHDLKANIYAEYKTRALDDKDLDVLFQRPTKSGRARTATFKVRGIYNGAYTQEAIDSYSGIDHYFGLFYKEQCILIIKPKTNEVISQLTEGFVRQQLRGGTTNLNKVEIPLDLKNLYSIVYKNDTFFEKYDEKKMYS